MSTNHTRHNHTSLFLALAGVAIAFSTALTLLHAEETEDLSDNETCLACHLDQEHLGLLDVGGKQVHNPEDGAVMGEVHMEFSCTDCHADILEIPHREDVERTVNCLDCHEEVPQ